MKRKYSNGDITVVWQPELCIHSGICWRDKDGLPDVFDPREKPWIRIDGASSARIISQVEKCPSGALSLRTKEDELKPGNVNHVEVRNNGPIVIGGPVRIKHTDGAVSEHPVSVALCRCGASSNKPFCDGSHVKVNPGDDGSGRSL